MTSTQRSRDRLRKVADQTVAIVQKGAHRTASGTTVDIAAAVAAAIAGTPAIHPVRNSMRFQMSRADNG